MQLAVMTWLQTPFLHEKMCAATLHLLLVIRWKV